MEKLPKAGKGFEMDFIDFTLNEKEEAQLKVGWVPQNRSPLRETIYVKFGKLKTQMLFVGTCKVSEEKNLFKSQLPKSNNNYLTCS